VPVAQGPLLGADAAGRRGPDGGLARADSTEFLDRGAAALSLLAPYTLNPQGTGPVAPEPPGAASPPTDTYAALLAPSNGSGALGLSLVTLDRARASVTVELVDDRADAVLEHASHIHGFADDRPSCCRTTGWTPTRTASWRTTRASRWSRRWSWR
jgi:hypothetical protein